MATDGDETNKSDNNTSMPGNEIKHWLDAYDRIYKIFELASSHYFIRTQIIMFAIQIILGTGFVKLVSDISSPICTQKLILLLAIPIIGSFFACAWVSFIEQQWNSTEFYRCYMRYIEKKLMNYGVPLAHFRAESAIFFWHQTINFTDPDSSNGMKSNPKDKPSLQTEFPYYGKEARSNRLMEVEGTIAKFIRYIWIACFVSICCIYWKDLSILPYHIRYVFIAIFLLVLIYRIMLKGWYKSQKNKNNGLLFIDSKFQNDLNECKPSNELKDEFNSKGIKLSGDYNISIVKEGSNWLIVDKDKEDKDRKKEYIVSKEGIFKKKLNIYDVKNFWELKEDEL